MIGNLVKKCKILDAIKVIELDETLKEITYKLAHAQGISKGMVVITDYICENIEIPDELNDKLENIIRTRLKEKIDALIKDIQKMLMIDDKFFICDIKKNIINVFDLSYDEFLDDGGKSFISEDLTKVIIPNK